MGIDFFGAKLFMMDPRLSMDINLPRMNSVPYMMGDLLEYFESQSRTLDELSTSLNSPLPSNFTSLIKFNGVPILPPVMTPKRREEMLTYRRQAMRLENRRKSRHREKLVEKVQSIVSEVEERQNSRLSESVESSPVSSGTDASYKWSPDNNSTKSLSRAPQNKDKGTSQNNDSKSKPSKPSESSISKQVNKTAVREQRTKIPAPVQSQKKAKPKPTTKSQGKALTNLRKSSSMSSLPNPAKIPGTPCFPQPKPPATKMTELQAKRSTMLLTGRLSVSNPDLRDFDDDNSLSCKSEGGVSRNRRIMKQSAWQQANQHSASDPDISRNEIGESQGFVLSPEDSILKSPKIHKLKKHHRSAGSNPELSSISNQPDVDPEQFRQEFLVSKHKSQKTTKSHAHTHNTKQQGRVTRTENQTPPTKDSTKRRQLPPEPKMEEPTSLNDYPSLDDCNSLPQEFSGLPLTSVKQQQIGQVLAKLSKCLNLQDTGGTMNSTSSSSSTDNTKQPQDNRQKYFQPPTYENQVVTTGLNQYEANTSGLNQSAVNSSVVSSVGSVGTNQSRRMSPKGLKNTVHFSSFVTEISTSASQSVEDKISVRKMDITPSNSTEFQNAESEVMGQYGKVPKNSNDLRSEVPQVTSMNSFLPGQPGSMLSKVALSPEESPGGTPKTFFKDQDVPFHVYTAEIDHNTSDKENENIFQIHHPLDSDEKLKIMERELNKNCEQTYGNVFMLTGKRESDDLSQGSTLKESQDNIPKNYFNNDGLYSDVNKTDFEKVMKVSSAVTGSSGHVTGEVNQSYQRTSASNIPVTNVNNSNVSRSSHVRHGSYTLENPSQALLNAQLRNGEQSQQPMNIGPESMEPLSITQNDMNISTSSAEQKAKEEHIQRYLSQVQSHQGQEIVEKQNNSRRYDIGEAVKSFTETLQSMESLTEDEMLRIQADHFNKIRQHLIEQQKQQLEELFIQQRREQMNLQQDIEVHHQHLRDQQMSTSFSDFNNLSQISMTNPHNTSVNSYMSQQNPGRSQNNYIPHSTQQSNIPNNVDNRYVPRTGNVANVMNNYSMSSAGNSYVPISSINSNIPCSVQSDAVSNSMNIPYAPGLFQNSSMLSDAPSEIKHPVYSQQVPANFPTSQQKQYDYISSPSLYFNPRDRDNESDISTFSKRSPKQSLKFNHSTPSPKTYKPVLHSPVKEVQNAWTSSTVIYSEDALNPRLQPCFQRVSACVKGYLTRRLLMTEKVQEIIKTINDTKNFARSFQQETPIKKGQVNNQDRDLLDRIIAQLQAALLDMHEIFFEIPMLERMQLIAHDRQLREERRLRESGATTRSSVSSSNPRISSATLKAMERKRKAQEAEISVFGDVRPRTAPADHQRAPDIDIRALQPVHHNSTHSGNTTARLKTRPKTAPSQRVQTHSPTPSTNNQQQQMNRHSNQQQQQTTEAAIVAKNRKTASNANVTAKSTSTATVASKKKKSGKAWR